MMHGTYNVKINFRMATLDLIFTTELFADKYLSSLKEMFVLDILY